MKNRFWYNFWLLVHILALLFIANAQSEPPPPKTDHLSMGFYAPSILDGPNRTDVEISLSFWAQELAFQLKHINSAPIKLFNDIDEMQTAFASGQLDLIIAPPLEIARNFNRADLVDGFMGVGAGKKDNALIVLTRTDKNINRIEDLQNMRLLMPEDDALATIFLETLTFKHFKKTYPQIFKSIQIQSKNNHMVLDVFFNKADVALVYENAYQIMLELNPQIKAHTKILTSFPVISRNYSYFHRNYAHAEEIINYVTTSQFINNPRLKQILEVFRTQEIDVCKVTDLERFDKLYQEYTALKK